MNGQRDIMRKVWRNATRLTVLVIVLHALIPINLSFASQPGSAFSAFTCDVSLGRGQAVAVEKGTVQAEPLPPLAQAPVASMFSGVAEAGGAAAPRPFPTGPLPADPALLPLNPRAPPAA